MVLCHAVHRVARWPLVVATVDHGLRVGSAADAAFVEATTRAWGLVCNVERAEHSAGAEGPEDTARRMRHAARESARLRAGAELIVYAHTADDQWETLMMRLAAGAGLTGLAGMRRRSGRRVRPWLAVTRAQVAEYAATEGVPWREDPTNADPRLLRNDVRRVLRPAAERVFGPRIAETAARTAETLAVQAAALEELLTAQRDRWVRSAERGADGGVVVTLDAGALRACSPALLRAAVHHLILELHALAERPPPRAMADRVERICRAVDAGEGRGVGGRDGFTMTQRRGVALWRLAPTTNRTG
jgi:tRNA(Ile)-lysidine synthase